MGIREMMAKKQAANTAAAATPTTPAATTVTAPAEEVQTVTTAPTVVETAPATETPTPTPTPAKATRTRKPKVDAAAPAAPATPAPVAESTEVAVVEEAPVALAMATPVGKIAGQIQSSDFLRARAADTVGKTLNSLLEEALRVGKKVRTETQIGKGAVSVTTAAIELARKIFETLEGKNVMIVGAGKIGEMTVKNLYSRGVSSVMVSNRTFSRAQDLARVFGGTAIPFDSFLEELAHADIVISSTSAPHYIIKRSHVERAIRSRGNVPLFLIDLGLPRNISPEINAMENVYLYNIDDLAQVAEANLKERQNEAKKAEEIIARCVEQAVRQLPFEEQTLLIK